MSDLSYDMKSVNRCRRFSSVFCHIDELIDILPENAYWFVGQAARLFGCR